MQDAVEEVADQLGLHRQVHQHFLRSHFAQLNAQHFIERNPLEETLQCVVQVGGEFERGGSHGEPRRGSQKR